MDLPSTSSVPSAHPPDYQDIFPHPAIVRRPEQRDSDSTDGEKYSRPSTPGETEGSHHGTVSEADTIPVGMMEEAEDRNFPYGPHFGRISPVSSFVEEKKQMETKGKRAFYMKDCCRPVLREYHNLPANPTLCEKLHYSVLCPPHGCISTVLTLIACIFIIWGLLYSMLGSTAAPGGNIFALIVLVITAMLGGHVMDLVHLPPLLGMLIVGILLRNVPKIDIGKDIDSDWASVLRNIALVVILSRAGLGLDPAALKRLSAMVFRLAFTPCIVEATTVAIASHLLLGFPWLWGFMLGFVLAAVSPAVVVPCLLHLQERGYGVEKGIPTLVIAAASIDDVLAISAFGIILGITFTSQGLTGTSAGTDMQSSANLTKLAQNFTSSNSTESPVGTGSEAGSLVEVIFQGPLEVMIGLSFGICGGILATYLPQKFDKNVIMFRFVLVFGGGLLALFGSQMIGYPGSGALGCLTLSFFAAHGWRKQGWAEDNNPVSNIFAALWVVFQPLLFSLIGTEIIVTSLDGNTIGMGILTLVIGLTIRVIVSFFVVMGGDLKMRERMFIALAWLPKATVQAAIGPVALDTARRNNAGEEFEYFGIQILTIAVLVILLTAPLGAIAITLSAPKLLEQYVPSLAPSRASEPNGHISSQQEGTVEASL